jgi:hypothetical protein
MTLSQIPGIRQRIRAIMTALFLTTLLGGSASAQEEREARSFIDRIGGTVFGWAWPTATYERVNVQSITPVTGGYNATVRLSGQSAFGGVLWMDVVLMLRNGRLYDVRIREHNAILAAPFSTVKALGSMVASMAESYAQSASSAAPTPQPSSFTLQIANDCHLPITVWMRYRTPSGEWMSNGPWSLSPLTSTYLLEGAQGSAYLRVTSRIVYSYAEPALPDAPISWSGNAQVTYGGRTLPMLEDTLRDDGMGSLILSRTCTNVPRLGVNMERAGQYQFNGLLYTHGVRVLEIQPGHLAERIGLRPGDVIYNVNNQIIESPDALLHAMIRFRSDPMTIHFIRGQSNLNVSVPATAGR